MTEDISFHYTPEELCKKLIRLIPTDSTDTWYEPFRGGGGFYNNFPEENRKDWAEITDGRDFYDNVETYDIICTNPPFRINNKNSLIEIMIRLFSQARKSVNLLMNVKCFNSLTPKRLAMFMEMGWFIENIHICNVKKWFGRYYFLRFTRNNHEFVSVDTNVY